MSTYRGNSGDSGHPANLFQNLFAGDGQERFDTILSHKGIRVERIVSHGQASEPGFWYDQSWDEWVLVVQGSAILRLIDPQERAQSESEVRSEIVSGRDLDQAREVVLNPGDHLLIPAHVRHRVESTCADKPTIWLAIHWEAQ